MGLNLNKMFNINKKILILSVGFLLFSFFGSLVNAQNINNTNVILSEAKNLVDNGRASTTLQFGGQAGFFANTQNDNSISYSSDSYMSPNVETQTQASLRSGRETVSKINKKDFNLNLESGRKDFSFAEKPQLEFRFKKNKGVFGNVGSFFRSWFTDEYKNIKIESFVVDIDGKKINNIESEVIYDKDGKFTVNVKNKGRQLKIGKYSLKVKISDQEITLGDVVDFNQDFTWGVLAFNSDQSLYLPGSSAYLQVAVLDDEGDTVCGADVRIEIDEPGWGKTILSTADDSIAKNNACGLNNVIDEPDYFAHFDLKKIGEYNITIIAETADGQRIISDKIEVKNSLSFIVKREGPTRIFPKADYGMVLRVKANEDYKGSLTEIVPKGFRIVNQELRIKNNDNEVLIHNSKFLIQEGDIENKLIWEDISLKSGEELIATYTFDAPDISPEFYLLGPLSVVADGKSVDIENRQWQIASDAVSTIGHYYKYDNNAYSGAPGGGVWDTISSYQISSTNFTAGKKYLISINFSLNNSSANANAMARVLHGSTEFAGSLHRWETSNTGAANTGHGYRFFTVWTAVSGEAIEVQVTNASAVTYYISAYQAFVINLSDDLVENTDWYYSTASNSGNLLTSWTTNGASVSIAGGGNDWMILGLGHYLSDSTSADLRMRLYNATDGVEYNAIRYETEDAVDERSFVLMSGANISGTKTWRVDASVDVASTHDWTDSAIFAINLDKFQSHYIGYSTENISLTTQNTWYQSTSTPFSVKATGDHLIWSQEVADTGDNAKVIESRIMVDGSVVPTGFPSVKRDLPHGALDENAHHNFYLGSLSAGSRSIVAEMRETVDISPAPVVDIHNLVIFSMELKTPPTSSFNSALERNNGSGVVDISMEVADADWEPTRVKVEWATSTDCSVFFAHDATLDATDANITADTGDPDIDNNHPYQVGTSTAYIITSSGSNTVNFDWFSKTDLPAANGETYCLRLTANDLRVDQASSTVATTTIDNTIPVISSIVTSNKMYKIGDTLRATTTVVSESGNLSIGPGSMINGGQVINIQKINNTTFTVDYVIAAGQTDRSLGDIPYSIALVDLYGNKSATSSGNFANGSIDANAPNITNMSVSNSMFKAGDLIIATITVTSDISVFSLDPSTINNVTVTNLQKIGDTTYTVDYLVIEGNTDRATGTIPYSIALKDGYGNINSAYTGSFTNGSIDAHSPIIQAVYLSNGDYKIGSNISVIIDADLSGYHESAITINGKSIINFIDNADSTYNVTYVVAEGDIDREIGETPISVVLRDNHGNVNSPAFTSPSGSITIDANKPKILTISLPNRVYKVGDVVRATTTVLADLDDYTLSVSTSSINWATSSTGNLQKIDNSTYTFDYTVQEGDQDQAAGNIPVVLTLEDEAGQYNSPASTSVQTNTASIDANSPIISGVSFVPSSGVLKVGDRATATISVVGGELGCTSGTIMKINNVDVINTFFEVGSGNYRVVYIIGEGETDHPDGDDLPVNFRIKDAAGNESNAYLISDPTNRPGVDANTPIITDVTFSISSGVLKVGDTATATITVADSESGLNAGNTMTINGVDVTGTFDDIGSGQYTVVYTVIEGHTDILDSNDLPVDFIIKDDAGNESVNYTTTDPSGRPGVDAHTPSIASVAFFPVSGVLKVGDTATATITVADNEEGLNAGDIMTINGVTVSGTFFDIGFGQYTVSYTVFEEDNDVLDSNDLPIIFTVKDDAGNESSIYNTADSDGRPGVDGNTPGIATITFNPSSGVLKVGDTATATITAINFETSLSTGTTMTINNIDISSTFSEIGLGQYTVSYTVTEGDIDRLDSADLPINISFRDSAGNESMASTTPDIAGRPGVDAHTPAVSIVSFFPSSGVLKIGDTATATLTSLEAEAGLNAGRIMTINGTDVSGTFNEIGGGQYTVTYTVIEGDTNRLDSDDLPVAFNIKDDAGNESSIFNTADILNRPGVDASRPIISNVTFNISSGLLGIGDIATATIFSDGTGYTAGTITINGVDVSGTLLAAAGNNYTVTYTVGESHANIDDSSDLPVNITLLDASGNDSNAYTASDIANRPGVDSDNPTDPGSLNFDHNHNNSITLIFGATTTETNFLEYKIYYKKGISGVTESDSAWTQVEDFHLGNILFNGYSTTTITGLATATDYVFNIYAYDSAGNKAQATEVSFRTNSQPNIPGGMNQYKNDGITTIVNGGWVDNGDLMFTASTTDIDTGNNVSFYLELASTSASLRTATTVPSDACGDGVAYNSCDSKIWTKAATSPAWYSSNWLYRKKIIIDAGQILSNEDNFPVLATTTDLGLKNSAREDGFDILFTASDGVTKLNYEREYFASSTGELVAWIKTNISSTTNTTLYMYYGNSGASTDNATTTGVWDLDYKGVWHLHNNPSGTVIDSTLNGNNMTPDATMNSTDLVAGRIGQAINFDGTGDELVNSSPSGYGTPGNYSMSAWFYYDLNPSGYDNFYSHTTATGDYDPQWTMNNTAIEVYDNGGDNPSFGTLIGGAGSWHKIDYIRASSLNGELWRGRLDEVRYSETARSTGWVKTEYNNQNNVNDFLSFEAEEQEVTEINITAILEYAPGYKWQVMACDNEGACSSWAVFNQSTPNFRVDLALPTAPGKLTLNSKTITEVKFDFGATTTEFNFLEYRIYYKIGSTTNITESDNLWGTSSDSNLGDILFNGQSSTTITNLTASTTYSFSIWAYDLAGNKASSAPTVVTTNSGGHAPVGAINSVAQKTNGSGVVDFSIEVDDIDNEDILRAKVEFATGTSCVFVPSGDPTLDTTDANITADYGDPDIDNGAIYQVGTTSGWILTSPGSNTVNFDWLSKNDIPNANGDYCVRITVNDGDKDQEDLATTTITIDNINPANPGNLSVISQATDSVILQFSDQSSDTNFSQKKTDGSVIANGGLIDDNDVQFRATSTDVNFGETMTFYYEILPNDGTFTVASSVPGSFCYESTAYASCSNNIWAASTTVSGVPSGWYNSDWIYRKEIILKASEIVSNEIDFPVLINSVISDLVGKARSDGYDILFTSSDGITELNYERESWNSSTGALVAWVQTDISSTTDTTLYMYYGNGDASIDNATTTGVWDTDYKGVWHLNNDPTGIVTDSTVNGNNMVSGGSMLSTDLTTGQIGQGIRFDGSNDSLQDTSPNGYGTPGNYTMSTWFYYSVNPSGWDNFYSHTVGGTNYDPQWAMNNTDIRIYDSGGDQPNFGAYTTGSGDWHKIDYIRTGSNVAVYIDGIYFGSGTHSNALSVPTTIFIGNSTVAGGEPWNGVLDEVRYSEINRSTGWIKTEFNNQNSPSTFMTLESEEIYKYYYSSGLTVSNITDLGMGYKWQAVACDDDNACSSWQQFDADIPNFEVDTEAPQIPGDMTAVSQTANSITLDFGDQTVDNNFREYRIYYQISDGGATEVSEADMLFGSSTDSNLKYINYNGAATTTVFGLQNGTEYEFNIWAYDIFGRKASATTPVFASTNYAPQGNFIAVQQKRNGSGIVDITIEADDLNSDNLRAKIEFATGTTCVFSPSGDPTLDETDANATSTYGDAEIENDNEYQIGNAGGWIITDTATNTVYFDWFSKIDIPNANGTYCLRLTVNDGVDDQLVSATTTLIIDNTSPTAPGPLSFYSRTSNSLTLFFGATTTETNFVYYKIYYKAGVDTVNEGDTSHTDPNLNNILFNGKSTTTINGLSGNTQYSFKVYVYDAYGNKNNSIQKTFSTNAYPTGVFNSVAQKIDGSGIVDISIEVYDLNGDNASAKLEFATGTTCIFSPSGDPTLDETDSNITADHGDPGIDNDNEYQVGTSTAMITTSGGSNTVNFDWFSKIDVPIADGDYCLRLTVNDGISNQFISATTTITLDNINPIAPGSLTDEEVTGLTVKLNFNGVGSDTNFSEYKIFYKKGTSGVTESDTPFTKLDDVNLGAEDFNTKSSTTISSLSQNTDYVFNIWIYDDFGNKASAASEVSTTTLILPSATWREEEDTVDPTISTHIGRNAPLRVRISIVNTGDWLAEDYRYRLEYGLKSGTCNAVSSWTPVPATSTGEHFEMVESIYFIDGEPTTARFINSEGYIFVPGYMLQKQTAITASTTLYKNQYTELEYTIQATASSTAGATYCFRVTDNGTVLDNYSQYPELSLAPLPTGTFVSAQQKKDASAIIDISIEVSDINGDLSRARIDYVVGTSCDFTIPLDPTLDETDANITAVYGDPDIHNGSLYQIGTGTNKIITQYGANTINFDWPTLNNLSDADDIYCLRLTANDWLDDQSVPATTTVIIDQVRPTDIGNLTLVDKTSNSITLGLGTSTIDTNFRDYRIYWKEGTSGVTESDNLWGTSSDASLRYADFNGATTTIVTGLTVNKQYVFRIWAYDDFGHKASSSEELQAMISYVSVSENWRWYYDYSTSTPLYPMADEDATPSDVVSGAVVKLRFAMREIEDITGLDLKMRLQYSTFSDFSSDVHFVGEIGSTSVLWTYGNGIDTDDDRIEDVLLSGVSLGATHNESGVSTSTFDHLAGSLAEWEFTIRNNNADIGTTYYFRAYDNTNGAVVSKNVSFTYPSIIPQSGNLSYTMTGFGIGSSTEGVVTNIVTTPSSVPFGVLTEGEDVIGAHRLNISTNAGHGYQLFVYEKQKLIANNGADIDPVTSPNENPASWPISPSPSAFGYHSGDDTLSGAFSSRFAPDDSYAKFETDMKEISYSEIPVINETVDLVYRVEIDRMQEAGDYATEIVYILVPTFY